MPNLGLKKGQEYTTKDCAHLKNMRLYTQRDSKSILAQINRLAKERNKKISQMKSIFHILLHGCLMLKYESLYELFKSINVPNNPSMHWSDNDGWTLAKFIFMQVQHATFEAIQSTKFLVNSCNEVTTIDNGFWICIHVYVVESWVKFPMLFQVKQIVNGLGSFNFIEVILVALMNVGGQRRKMWQKSC